MKIYYISPSIDSPSSFIRIIWRNLDKMVLVKSNTLFLLAYSYIYYIGITNDGYTATEFLVSTPNILLVSCLLLLNSLLVIVPCLHFFIYKNRSFETSQGTVALNGKRYEIYGHLIQGDSIVIRTSSKLRQFIVWTNSKDEMQELNSLLLSEENYRERTR